MFFSFSSRRCPWCWQDAPCTRRVIHLLFERRYVHRQLRLRASRTRQ